MILGGLMQTRSVVEEQALDKNCVQLLRRCLQKLNIDYYYLHEAAMERARFDDNRILILI